MTFQHTSKQPSLTVETLSKLKSLQPATTKSESVVFIAGGLNWTALYLMNIYDVPTLSDFIETDFIN